MQLAPDRRGVPGLACVKPQHASSCGGDARGGTKSVSGTGVCQDGRDRDLAGVGRGLAHRLARGRARGRDPTRHAAAADAAGSRPRVRPARRGRLDGRRHGPRAARRPRALGGGAERAAGRRAPHLRHALPSRPRRRGRRRRRAHRRAGRAGTRSTTSSATLVWGGEGWADVLVDWFGRHGVPAGRDGRADRPGLDRIGPSSASSPIPSSLEPGDAVGGWQHRRGAGPRGRAADARCATACSSPRDHLLDRITPTVGLWPASRPDPLGDYLDALEATIALDATSRAPGSRRADRRPGGAGTRARRSSPRAPRRDRRRRSADEPRTAYDVSFALFGDDLKPARAPLRGRRDALAPRAARAPGRALGARSPTGSLPILPPEWTASYRPVPAPRDAGRPLSVEAHDE